MRSPANCPRPVAGKMLFDGRTGDILPLPCKTWGCGVCGPAKAHRLGAIAAAAGPERFITLSRVGPDLETVYRRLQTLSKALRRLDYTWEYLTVPEIHQNGFWHMHLLHRGDFIPQRVLSSRAHSAGMGYVVDIRKIRGAEEVPKYLCKYITKQTSSAGIGRSKRSKRYRTSRNFWPGGLDACRERAFSSTSPWSVVDVGPYVELS